MSPNCDTSAHVNTVILCFVPFVQNTIEHALTHAIQEELLKDPSVATTFNNRVDLCLKTEQG